MENLEVENNDVGKITNQDVGDEIISDEYGENTEDASHKKTNKKEYNIWKAIAVVLIVFIFVTNFNQTISLKKENEALRSVNVLDKNKIEDESKISKLEEDVLPKDGIVLPIKWDNLGKKMIEAGVIDKDKFEAITKRSSGLLTTEQTNLLYGEGTGSVKMTIDNAQFLLNLFWGFGLANKSTVLDSGPMSQNNIAPRLASTGGWTISVGGDPMKHFSAHNFVVLSAEQSKKVEEITKNIYRPCCGNSTYFPDCNHGMAMLGLVELLVANGISDQDIYKIALRVNYYWFPDTYLTIATYLEDKGIVWSSANSKEILGADYSGGQGYQKIKAEVDAKYRQNLPQGLGSGCDLDSAGGASAPSRSSGGCGL